MTQKDTHTPHAFKNKLKMKLYTLTRQNKLKKNTRNTQISALTKQSTETIEQI